MPVAKGTSTAYVAQSIQDLVNRYNRLYSNYVRDYNRFMEERARLLVGNNRSLATLLNDLRFAAELRQILAKFGMDARASALVSHERLLDTMSQVSPRLSLLSTTQIRLHALSLRQMVNGRTVASIIRDVFELFETAGQLSAAGGFVIASKTMHFILPEVFVMLDGQHIAVSLYNISDYYPHPDDGRDWFDVIPNYSGRKPNPSPRGEGRKSWDNERYCIALMYYKRIIREWCQQNNSNIQGFLNLDTEPTSSAARVIDKALW